MKPKKMIKFVGLPKSDGMPTLDKLVIQDWRNIQLQELGFCANVNCISGGNGEGKTNLLDAVHYLSMTKSAFGNSDRYNFRHGCSSFALCGTYTIADGKPSSRIEVKVSSDGSKRVCRDEKPYRKVSEHIGLLPIVMVSPGDSVLVTDSGEERRRFSSSVLSQMDREFLDSLQRYNRLLSQRNALLKDVPDPVLMETLDEQLSRLAEPVFRARDAFARDLEPLVRKYYAELSGSSEQVGIRYRSDLQAGSLSGLLRESFEKDKALRFTSAGIQRDDLVFTMDGDPIRKVGSQGQQKTFLVALKFAQYEIMKRSYGFPPILLLDDLFDKLDMNRTSNLLKMVSSADFGQIFITDSNKVRLRSIMEGITQDTMYYDAEGGVFSRR